jgi:acyl dehydratase
MSDSVSTLVPGHSFTLSRGPVTTTQLVMYAGASGDFNRIHFDQDFARQVGLGGLVAHGMLTMGFAGSCLTSMVGARQIRELRARFLAPVRVGDVVEARGTVREVLADGDIVIDLEAKVGETSVLKGHATIQAAS